MHGILGVPQCFSSMSASVDGSLIICPQIRDQHAIQPVGICTEAYVVLGRAKCRGRVVDILADECTLAYWMERRLRSGHAGELACSHALKLSSDDAQLPAGGQI